MQLNKVQPVIIRNGKKTTVGYMPLIQAPEHEFDKLNTVVQRCMYIADHNGQFYVVSHVDKSQYN